MGVIVGQSPQGPTMGSMSENLPTERSDTAIGGEHQQVTRLTRLRQAPVEPLQDDGVRAFLIGTVLFALAWVLALLVPQLASERWWLIVAPTGTTIGVVGIGYCVWRRNREAKTAAQDIVPPAA